MRKEELLKPRYKVIADYPNSIWTVGEILPDFPEPYAKENFGKYPHLFKPLQWWEERENKDMPEYVCHYGELFKVQEWHIELAPKVSVFINPKIHSGYADHATDGPLYGDILPATEQEYSDYIKSKA